MTGETADEDGDHPQPHPFVPDHPSCEIFTTYDYITRDYLASVSLSLSLTLHSHRSHPSLVFLGSQ